MMYCLPAFLALLGISTARVYDQLPAVPAGWRLASPALATDRVTLKLALKQQHAAALEHKVLAVSTPGHPDYGKHLTREELRAYVAPTRRATDEVVAWLAAKGIAPAVDNDWMTLTTDVGTANALLDARFAWYEHTDGGGLTLRTLSYSVPDAVAPHVDLVQPTTRFGGLGAARSTIFNVTVDDDQVADRKEATASNTSAPCHVIVVPACLKAMYNIGYTPSQEGNLVAFASFLEQYARKADLMQFQYGFLPDHVEQGFSVELINGGKNKQRSHLDAREASLDLQWMHAVSAPIALLMYSTGGRGPLVPTKDNRFPSTNEPYLEFLTHVLSLDDTALPQTLTISYGEEEQSVPAEYAIKVCNLFMQLGARGVSILFSSGDAGPGRSCKSNVDNTTTTFLPEFPAGCPYVTSVGGTTG